MSLRVWLVAVVACMFGTLGMSAPVGAGSGADDSMIGYAWSGATPVDAFVCGVPAVGCPGYIVADTDWIDDLPGDRALSGVDVTLTWTPVDDMVGPLVFRLAHMSADGTLTEELVFLEAEASPLRLQWSGEPFADGEFGRLTVWPAEKATVGPFAVYVDLAEQPFEVDGSLTFA